MFAFTGTWLIDALVVETLQTYSVRELNTAIGNLLERGFVPRFLLHATISKAQLKKGHLWLTLTDGEASITGVAWASTVQKLQFIPEENDGVTIVGKLNFWTARANLSVQVLDIRPNISTVLRKFEIVASRLEQEGIINAANQRSLPCYPGCVAILTSVPSSALADMLRTAKERWPLTKLLIIPIPVQGEVAKLIQSVLSNLALKYKQLGIDAIVLARGGGSREDLMLFDNEELCREISKFPVPVVTGLGHEDDLTVADLVSDHRAATPTAAMVALLPSREFAQLECNQREQRLVDSFVWLVRQEKKRLLERRKILAVESPQAIVKRKRISLDYKGQLLNALSPERLLANGFAIVRNETGDVIMRMKELALQEKLTIQFHDGQIDSIVEVIHPRRKSK